MEKAGIPVPDGSRTARQVAVAIVLILIATVAVVRLEGRVWYCECGGWDLWKSSVWSSHCSQHVSDPYTISHISHGLIFWCMFHWLFDRVGPRRFPMFAAKVTTPWRLVLSVFIAAVWEIAENSTWVIERYRSVTMSLDYMGDSVTNATCDVLFCALGFYIAQWLKFTRTLMLFIAFEIILLITIKDNLTLNVIMLLTPIQAIKDWQMEGQLPVGG